MKKILMIVALVVLVVVAVDAGWLTLPQWDSPTLLSVFSRTSTSQSKSALDHGIADTSALSQPLARPSWSNQRRSALDHGIFATTSIPQTSTFQEIQKKKAEQENFRKSLKEHFGVIAGLFDISNASRTNDESKNVK